MKLLFSSPDLGELGGLVKRQVWARIPCAVCKAPVNSHLSVWIQRDIDFPLALHIFTHRHAPCRLPHWARALDAPLPAANGIEAADGLLVQLKVPTWTGTTCATAPGDALRQTRPAGLGSLPLIPARGNGLVKRFPHANMGSGRSEAHFEEAVVSR
jgi:hypothetical protein